MSVEGVPSEDLVLAVRPLVLHLPLVLFLLLTLLHHLQQNNGSMCQCGRHGDLVYKLVYVYMYKK